jgi:hypothetical protein
MPALALAEDQREPNASPDDFLAAVLAAGLFAVTGEAVDEMEDVAACEEKGAGLVFTLVK